MLLSILLIVFSLVAFDRSRVGRALRRWLVEAPADRLARLSRGQVLGLGVVVLLGWAAMALFEAEGLRLFAMAAPELTGWVMLFDVTVVFDMMVLALSLRALAGWRGLTRIAATVLRQAIGLARPPRQARPRDRRDRRTRPPRDGSSDIDPDAVFA
jgi:hypothetical protein